MSKEVTIELTSPVTTHQGEVRTWVLREPKHKDYFAVGGAPYEVSKPVGGEEIVYEIADRIEAYIERCTVAPGAEFLVQVTLADSLRLKDAVLGFFGDALATAYPKPPSSSSTTSAGSVPSNAAS